MSALLDPIGDLLREFYAFYGAPSEGPRAEDNVTELVGNERMSQHEFLNLRRALDDERARKDFLACKRVLEDLANRLTTDELLREISSVTSTSDAEFEQLSNGVLWFSLAASLDQRVGRMPKLPPGFEAIDLPLASKVNMTVVGSLVLRLYVALVLMREGALKDLTLQGARAHKPCCTQVQKLLNSEYVGRIRNALSHGSFSSSIAGLSLQDKHGILVGTPGFLSWLCTWLNLIQLQALAASARRERVM
jgi:hypothetical protein